MNSSAISRTGVAVALVSFASLLLELGMTRLFSVVLFYHFAFLAISVALLGLGAGGVFSYVRRPWLDEFSIRQIGAWCCGLNALAIIAVLEVVLHLPISLEFTKANFGKLSVVYLVTAIPFFFTGLLFSVVFAREKEGIGRVYGADLLGGALACLAIVPLLNSVGGPNAIVFAAAAMAGAAAIWVKTAQARIIGLGFAGGLVMLIGANCNGRLIDVIYAKGLRRDRSQAWVEFAKWNAISRVEVNSMGDSKYVVIDADASTAIMNVDPKRWEETVNPPANLNLIDRQKAERVEGYNWKKDLMSAAPSIANVLRPDGKFAIIGPGGGVDVLRAVANGSKDVTAIEINPIIATDVMRGKYADYSYHLYERPEVHLHVADGRSFIRSSKDQYDVVQMTLVDTWASTAAGAFALSENNLYTVEAFKEYFNHLRPNGFIAITRWEFKEPREALRVVSQGMAALTEMGIPKETVRRHFFIVTDGALNEDGRPVIVLAKKQPFTREEADKMLAHVAANPNLRIIRAGAFEHPLMPDTVAAWRPFVELLAQKQDPALFAREYAYDVSPVYDGAPFFFFTLKTGDVLKKLWSGTGRGIDWRINLGVIVLFMVFGISIVAVLAFLILPLALHDRAQPRPALPHSRLWYFIAIGLGFIFVEIALIQRFVLFLGHPTYALTVVVFLMLLASGAGSLVSRRWIADSGRVWLPLLTIAAGVLLYVVLLPTILSNLVGQAFVLKLLISAILIAPLGFLMGMPFPTGLRALAEADDRRAEWAWALNGGATVLGSVSAMIIAIHFGLNMTLACGAFAYVLAAAWRVQVTSRRDAAAS